ncbi:hypothetical protein [Thalassotalea litorea]|uniref:hypothetical protein n=1 Tax=Thalassotalea litorea TaxID=2020715 RepID=UPI0037354202
MRKVSACLVGLLFLVALKLMAAEISIDENSFEESFSHTVQVSGNFYVGLQMASDDNIEQLVVLFPEGSTGMLCIAISSIDGRYKAKIEQEISSPISGWTQVLFDSAHQGELNKYIANELAVLARVGGSCTKSGARSILSSWYQRVSNDQEMVLLLRSDARKDTVVIDGHDGSFKCKKFKNSYKVTYDKYCPLKGIDITQVPILEVQRKNLQDVPDEKIELAYQ